jgi:endonuclease/exonuclease/phosphatase family metal-dependent hydrolase
VSLPGNSKEAFYTGISLYVKGWLAGETIHVYVNHWPSRRGGEERSSPAREAAAAGLQKHLDSILQAEGAAKIIVMGDLNDDPDSPSMTHTLRVQGIHCPPAAGRTVQSLGRTVCKKASAPSRTGTAGVF